MAAADVAVRWADAADLPRVAAFWRREFGPDSVQALPGRAAWLFGGQPAGPAVAIAESDGDLVAACGHVVQDVVLPGGGTCPAAFGVDFMVTPAFRRRGLGARLLDLRLDRFPLSLSTGQSAGMAALYRDRGAVDLGGFHEAVACRRPRPGRGARGLVRDVAAWLSSLRRTRVAGGRTPLAAAEAPAAAGRLDPAVDAAWFAWRFGGPVYPDHTAVRLAADDREGVLVARRRADAEILVHLAADPRHRRDLLALAAATSPAPALETLAVGDALAGDLASAGFLVRPRAARLIGMSRDAGVRKALRPGALDLWASAADADLLRRPDRDVAAGGGPC